jgi:hypothetical protein
MQLKELLVQVRQQSFEKNWKIENETLREKYILALQTTTLSPDGLPNYQCLDSGPPNYHFLIFWPHTSIYTVNFKQNSENTPPTL